MYREVRRSLREKGLDVNSEPPTSTSLMTVSLMAQITPGEKVFKMAEQSSTPSSSFKLHQTPTTTISSAVHSDRLPAVSSCKQVVTSDSHENSACVDPGNHAPRNSKRRDQARRHLSQSLKGTQTMFPALRRIHSFNAASRRSDIPLSRETGSLKHRGLDEDKRAGMSDMRRTKSLKEASGSALFPLTLSLARPTCHLDINSLVHDLDTSLKHPALLLRKVEAPNGHRANGSESDVNGNDDNFDSDLLIAPWTLKHAQYAMESANRALTPALRNLNKRRLSSRVRTQQWVNQIDTDSERSSGREQAKMSPPEHAKSALIYEQEF